MGAFVALWLGVQLGVPAVRLVQRGGSPRPRTFGWQMFTSPGATPPEQFFITTARGTRAYDPRPLLIGPIRREVRLASIVVPVLCDRPEILRVEVRDAEDGTTTVTCR